MSLKTLRSSSRNRFGAFVRLIRHQPDSSRICSAASGVGFTTNNPTAQFDSPTSNREMHTTIGGLRAHASVYTGAGEAKGSREPLVRIRLLRRGGRHDVWTDGEREEAVPRHREINEQLARAILRRACRGQT